LDTSMLTIVTFIVTPCATYSASTPTLFPAQLSTSRSTVFDVSRSSGMC
jgi:hypothetical protein